LKHQALCPFRAFASNRLAADGLESPVDGISPMLHGSLLHGVLELFWKQTRSRLALEHLSVDILSERVRRCVEEVVQGERGLQQRPAFQGVEADRLYRLVLAYLRLELERDDFEVVAFEKEIQPDIGGRNVRLIIDRVDKLSTGEEIIMDYKSGKVEPKNWFGDRPADPQLPLYAITAEKTPVAVVFAVIRDDGCAYKGVVRNTGVLPGLPPKITRLNQYLEDAGKNMPETIDNWRQILHRLMSDFLAGKASIDPRDGRKTCDNTYCDLQSLCRFGELEHGQKYGSEQGK
jgi:ATP-dependent helicase/DNAse subunit B